MIRTHPQAGSVIFSTRIALMAIPTTWAFAQTGFGRSMRRRAVSLLWLLVCAGGLNVIPTFAQGIITTVAGNGFRGFSGDGGPAASAQLNITDFTGGVAADAAGNLYIADTGNHRVRKIAPNGIISTVAGNGALGFSGDGSPAPSASLFAPTGLGLDPSGNLYIVDTGNQRIRRVGPEGIITTVAGNGSRGFSGDGGMATAASLSLGNVQYLGIAGYPTSVAVDGAGNLYIADTDNRRIRKVNSAGIISTALIGLRDPYGVAADTLGNLFIADSSNDRILKVSPGGVVTTIAGTLYSPSGVAVDRAGNLYIADSHSHRVRKVEPNGSTTIVAGSGDPIFDPIEGYYFVGGYSGDGGPATSAQLNFPWGVAVNAAGNIYIADSLNNRIRKVTAENSGPAQNTFTNPQNVRICDLFSGSPAIGSPYPSAITVSGLAGSVSKVTVTLTNFATTFPADLDFLLVGPNGQSSILMSGVSANDGTHYQNLILTFDDAASSSLTNGPIVSGTYRPSPLRQSTFPAPAPAGGFGTALSVFNGTSPNGEWKLYAIDVNNNDPFEENCTNAGGWSLTVTTTTPSSNPIDDSQFLIRQHYLDFLNRPADDLGLAFWTNEIISCGFDPQCIEIKRINVSAAFFLSIEFQQTGYLVYRMYKAAHGDMPGTPVPLTRQEFLPDTQRVGQGVVVDAPGWEQQLENNKNAFAGEFVTRSRFTTAFPQGMTAEQFVDALNANAGGTPKTTVTTTPKTTGHFVLSIV